MLPYTYQVKLGIEDMQHFEYILAYVGIVRGALNSLSSYTNSILLQCLI
jgi:hypothetical protein